jgi:filamentous hemagglutinin family protein
MNRDFHLPVFCPVRLTWLAAPECARRRAGRGRARRRAAALTLALAALAAHGRSGVVAPPPNAVPAPAVARAFAFEGSVHGGMPSIHTNANGGRDMRIETASRLLGLNWDSFNIGSQSSVTFVQPDATSRVLNRIWDANPSVIMGRLDANGQVYLLNQNGILFGNGAQVNLGGLVASALGVSDTLLERGIPSNAGESLEFAWQGDAGGFARGFVAVDAGASIRAAHGPVVMLAPALAENKGAIAAPEAILAAGGSVLLTAPADPNLRGLLVEARSWRGSDLFGNAVTLSGTVRNQADGSMQADGQRNGTIDAGEHGVATLASLAVNQEGVVRARRAINLNGEIMLVAGSQDTRRLTITQPGRKAEIDWQGGFGVDPGQVVEFVQPGSGAITYNFVHDPDRTAADGQPLNRAGPTTIAGELRANGQLALINEKGIHFASTARVTAANFIASALGIAPDAVADGLLGRTDPSRPAFALRWSDPVAPAGEDPLRGPMAQAELQGFRAATVRVDEGATIVAGNHGYALLAGGRVENHGRIVAPEGQVLLAAGARLYLKPPYGQDLRGFSPEVDPLYLMPAGSTSAQKATHAVLLSRGADGNRVLNRGEVLAPFGNITLVGHEIEQAGRLESRTSVTRNGSIRLIARDLVAGMTRRHLTSGRAGPFEDGIVLGEQFEFGILGGHLRFAAGSRTGVSLDGSDGRSVTADQKVARSSIDALARTIHVEGRQPGIDGAHIEARGGDVRFATAAGFTDRTALEVDPLPPGQGAAPAAGVGIFVGSGASIDVSGAVAKKSAADLFVEVELRGDEFAGNPVQRRGPLRGQKAWVDIRDPVAIADLSGYFSKVGQTLAEKSSAGGTIALRSEGSVIVRNDALLDVSGGHVEYAAGPVRESRVLLGRTSYRLNDAPADLPYSGLATLTRHEPAHLEGKSAGSVEISGHSLALDGTLRGHTARGLRQRRLGDPATDRHALPQGAKLIVRDGGQHFQPAGSGVAERQAAYAQAQIAFVRGPAQAAQGLDFGAAAPRRLDLSDGLLAAGFTRFDLRSDGRIDVPAGIGLNLGPGGEFAASGRQVAIHGWIVAPGGQIALATRDMSLSDRTDTPFPTEAQFSVLEIGAGARLDTTGRWVNDLMLAGDAPAPALALHGGRIALDSAYDIDIRADAVLDVSGGARLHREAGRERFVAGNAGAIRLVTGGQASQPQFASQSFSRPAPEDRRDASLFLEGRLAGMSFARGGSLEIATSRIRFGPGHDVRGRNASRAERLTQDRVGADFEAAFLDQGGFADFRFVGRDGVRVAAGVRLAPAPLSWTLEGVRDFRFRESGAPIDAFARSERLHADRRSTPTSLTLATRSLVHGDLEVGQDAFLGVDPLGAITLESWRQLDVLGTLSAPGGLIRLARPPNATNAVSESFRYSDDAQSRSIFLGAQSRLLAGGATRLDADTRRALDQGLSAGELRATGRYRGRVLDGGTVDVNAGLGYVAMQPGAHVDVAGAADSLDLPAQSGRSLVRAPQRIGSAGGRIVVAAREGMFLDGSFRAEGGANAPGGTFVLNFANDGLGSSPWDTTDFPAPTAVVPILYAPRTLHLYQTGPGQSRAPAWPTDIDIGSYRAGTAVLPLARFNGQAWLDLALLQAGGFSSWYLHSQDRIVFNGAIDAGVAGQMRLDSPRFQAAPQARTSLRAAALQIGNSGAPATSPPVGGDAVFAAEALDLSVFGNSVWDGFATTRLESRGELHFDSVAGSGGFAGALRGAGKLELAAARISPSTYSNFQVDYTGGQIDISRRQAVLPLAPAPGVAARLGLRAHQIVHDGNIWAPLGRVDFEAPGGSVTLAATSATSVSGRGVVAPLGRTEESGRRWVFAAAGVNPASGQTTSSVLPVRLEDKGIRVDAAATEIRSGALLDLSGGGEAVAWEFSPGPGGKTDVLAPTSGQSPDMFAILPGWSGAFAPHDANALHHYQVSRPRSNAEGGIRHDAVPALRPGDQIRLAGNPTGKVGLFTLLPASYALLPGASLVTLRPAQAAPLTGAERQNDGSWLVSGTLLATQLETDASGRFAPALNAYSQRPMAVELASREVVARRAAYIETTATRARHAIPGAQLPGDAGRLSVAGRSSLVFDPVVLGHGAGWTIGPDGQPRPTRGIELDLAAPRIEVAASGSSGSGAGWTVFDLERLDALAPSSLLLGGVRQRTEHAEGIETRIETVAEMVRIATGGAPDSRGLQAPEILLAARTSVAIESGSDVAASGEAPAADFVIDGDGAFARIAGGEQASLRRSGTVTRSVGDLILQEGASVTGRSLILDATRDNRIEGAVALRNANDSSTQGGGALAIGAQQIHILGGGASRPAQGLSLDNATLAGLGAPDRLHLTSYSTIDFHGDAQLGTEHLADLVLIAAGLAGQGSTGHRARIAARNVLFENRDGLPATFAAGGAGGLDIAAQSVVFGGNASAAMRQANQEGFALRGFADVQLRAERELRFAATGVTHVAGDLAIDAGRVIAGSGADHRLRADGALRVSGGGNAAAYDAALDMGGRLDMAGASFDVAGRIVAPGGRISLGATGAGGSLRLAPGALVATDGVSVDFGDLRVHTPGGTVDLAAADGDVVVGAGARVSVSGAAGSDSGSIVLRAPRGAIDVAAGSLRGVAGSEARGASGGALTVDARTVDLDALAAAVREPGAANAHLTGQWDIRRRVGTLTLAEEIRAGKVLIAADQGGIKIGDGIRSGRIDASGAKGGRIELYARDGDVELSASGSLLAAATERVGDPNNAGTRGRGGTVVLGARDGKVRTAAGSRIDVGSAPGGAAAGGEVLYRADASASTLQRNDLNIVLDGTVQGATRVVAEFVHRYAGTRLTGGNTSGQTLGLATIGNALAASYDAASVSRIRQHLGFADVDVQRVRPGIEITTPTGSTSDFTVSGSDIHLGSLRFQGEPGVLTLRAPRDLRIDAALSDGFASAARDGTLNAAGDSWAYRLVAGADPGAANPFAVLAPPAPNATVSSDPLALKGDIVLAQNRFVRTGTGDIALAARRNVSFAPGAAIYTAGRADGALADFVPYSTTLGGIAYRSVFPFGGGDVVIRAGEGIAASAPQRHVNEWLVRVARSETTARDTQWFPRFGSFLEGVGALGGGDVSLHAGGDIRNLTVAIPTSARVPGAGSGADRKSLPDQAKILGGGNLDATAGGSIIGGLFYAESGQMSIRAGGAIAAETNIALGNTEASLFAGGGGAEIGNVFNPLWARQHYVNNAGGRPSTVPENADMLMGTYGETSSLRLLALSGDIRWNSTGSYARDQNNIYAHNMLRVAPPRVQLAAPSGSVHLRGFFQAPAANGQIDVLARQTIRLDGEVVQLDMPAGLLPSLRAPLPHTDSVLRRIFNVGGSLTATERHAPEAWHLNDLEPSRLIALEGDIEYRGFEISRFNEMLRARAGRDVSNFSFVVQHARPDNVSTVEAGRDVRFDTAKDVSPPKGVRVSGPGRMEILAMRNIDLGNSGGVVARGNLDNFFLPEGSADLYLLAGAKPDYAGLRTFLGADESVSETELRSRFFDYLRVKGRQALAGGGEASYEAGSAAIRALFPATAGYGGSIDLVYSQIKTEQDSDITLFAPMGGIAVGIAVPDKDLVEDQRPSDQGIFTIRGGDISALVRDNFLVNQSRVFTLDGGHVLVWSDRGNIDAGSGAKTVSATPPPVVVIRNGQIVLDTSNSVAGSGIGVLASRPDTPASDLDLFAPQGAIDAGDAGLRATGNINLGAQVVLNATNIQAGGAVAGVPAVAPPPASVAPPASAASNQVAGDQTAAVGAATSREAPEGILTVEVLAVGAGDCAPQDEECLRRQRAQ